MNYEAASIEELEAELTRLWHAEKALADERKACSVVMHRKVDEAREMQIVAQQVSLNTSPVVNEAADIAGRAAQALGGL